MASRDALRTTDRPARPGTGSPRPARDAAWPRRPGASRSGGRDAPREEPGSTGRRRLAWRQCPRPPPWRRPSPARRPLPRTARRSRGRRGACPRTARGRAAGPTEGRRGARRGGRRPSRRPRARRRTGGPTLVAAGLPDTLLGTATPATRRSTSPTRTRPGWRRCSPGGPTPLSMLFREPAVHSAARRRSRALRAVAGRAVERPRRPRRACSPPASRAGAVPPGPARSALRLRPGAAARLRRAAPRRRARRLRAAARRHRGGQPRAAAPAARGPRRPPRPRGARRARLRHPRLRPRARLRRARGRLRGRRRLRRRATACSSAASRRAPKRCSPTSTPRCPALAGHPLLGRLLEPAVRRARAGRRTRRRGRRPRADPRGPRPRPRAAAPSLAAALAGRHVAVEGPPGTGLTHTLAACVAGLAGRAGACSSSRRTAARADALCARLDAAGLGDLVLALHDGTGDRPRLLAALGAALDAAVSDRPPEAPTALSRG